MRYWGGAVCLIVFSAVLFADAPVATVSSSEPFVLRGAEVPVHGVPSWPVFAGDDIIAGKAPAILKLSCGSRVRLNPGAEATVSLDGEKLTVHLVQGDLTYKLSKDCPLAVAGPNGAAVAATSTGTATLVKTVLIVTPIVAGAAAYGVSRGGSSTSNPPSVSAK